MYVGVYERFCPFPLLEAVVERRWGGGEENRSVYLPSLSPLSSSFLSLVSLLFLSAAMLATSRALQNLYRCICVNVKYVHISVCTYMCVCTYVYKCVCP